MRKNIKVIIGIVIGITIGAVSGVYATLSFTAGDIEYTKSGTNTKISVANALNELYQNKNETTDNVQSITQNGSIQLDKYYKNLNVNVPIPAGYVAPSGTKTITTKANNIDVSSYQYADTTGMYTADEYTAKTGAGQYWKQGSFKISNNGTFNVNLGFEPKTLYIYAKITNAGRYVDYYDGQKFLGYGGGLDAYDDTRYYEITSNGFRNGEAWTGCEGDIEYYIASYE